MPNCQQDPPSIASVPPDVQPQAMALLWGQLESSAQKRLIESFEAEAQTLGNDYWSGLVGSFRDQRLTGAAWAQWQPGRAAAIHGPRLNDGEPGTTAGLLLSSLIERISAKDIRVGQALRDVNAGAELDWLTAAGFERAAELLYMYSEERSFPVAPPQTGLQFESFSPQIERRLAAVLSQTYVGSRDCPMIDGVRDIDDVLEGYRATGVFDPCRWLLISAPPATGTTTTDVGCLILTDHPVTQQWELVYMGIVPTARGRGWGLEIVRHAQSLARQAHVPRLVLAVDAANEPAVAMYSAAGFQTWDRRSVFLRAFENNIAEK